MFFGHIRWRALGRSRVGKGNAERLMKSACRTISLGKLNKILDSQSLRRKRNHETGIKFLIKHTLPSETLPQAGWVSHLTTRIALVELNESLHSQSLSGQ